MNGAAVTLMRVKPLGNGVSVTFTTKGVIVDSVSDGDGNTTGIRIQGTRVESREAVDSWYAVGPDALNGSLCMEQTVTLDLCGHEVSYGCDCDTIAAEAADQDGACTCTRRVSLGCEADDCVIRDEPRVISPYGAETLRQFSID